MCRELGEGGVGGVIVCLGGMFWGGFQRTMHWEQEEGSGKGCIEAGGCIWVSGVVWSSPE